MEDIKEIQSQISDNKIRYIHLDQQITVNSNKKLEYSHTIRTHKANEKELKDFDANITK